MYKESFYSVFYRSMKDHIELFNCIQEDKILAGIIQEAAEIVLRSINKGGALFVCGNGGSAADSQHIATEFVSKFYKERKAINAEALSVNTSSLTAIGNDYSFDRVFERQLEAKGKAGDVLIGISTSGISPNVIKALEYAGSQGIRTILLTGNRKCKGEFDCVIHVPSNDTPRIQEAHIYIGHLIAEYVENMISGDI